jgi:hypothetical protein
MLSPFLGDDFHQLSVYGCAVTGGCLSHAFNMVTHAYLPIRSYLIIKKPIAASALRD